VDFLGALAGRSGETVRRDSLIRALGEEPLVYDPRRLEVMVRRLRNKVEAAGITGFPLTTVYGQGYAFNAPLKEA
jgi:DNA-binding response OmpR family regulator